MCIEEEGSQYFGIESGVMLSSWQTPHSYGMFYTSCLLSRNRLEVFSNLRFPGGRVDDRE